VSEEHNRVTANSWEAFASHRMRVATLLEGLGRQHVGGRLCVVGAGNLNDLDLNRLLAPDVYYAVTLFDIDGAALSRGLTRFGAATSGRVTSHGGTDVLGPEDRLADGTVAARFAALVGKQRCDVVAGTTLVSQLAVTLKRRLRSHDAWTRAVPQLVEHYMQVLAALARPGLGTIVHISDLARRRDARRDSDFSEAQIVSEHMQTGDFLAGTNPAMFLPGSSLESSALGRALSQGDFWRDARGAPRFWSWCLSSDEQQALDPEGCFVVYAMTWRVTSRADPRTANAAKALRSGQE